jgi:heterotetrameric sarcosine oxidase gamma subunit
VAELNTVFAPAASSPLGAPDPAPQALADAGVVVEDLSLLAKAVVRCNDETAARAALGTRFGRSTRLGVWLVAGSGPGEWTVLAPADTRLGLADQLRGQLSRIEAFTSVVDITHGRALVRLRGPRVRELLARVTAFDLDDRYVPDGAAWRTWVAAVVTDLIRDDLAGQPSYLLHCERSSGRYLADALLAAGADLPAVLAQGAWDASGARTVTGPKRAVPSTRGARPA